MHVNQYVPHFLRFPQKIEPKEFRIEDHDPRVNLEEFDKVLTSSLFDDRKTKYHRNFKDVTDFDEYDSDEEKSNAH